jgi:Ca-activated chloride channel family protein
MDTSSSLQTRGQLGSWSASNYDDTKNVDDDLDRPFQVFGNDSGGSSGDPVRVPGRREGFAGSGQAPGSEKAFQEMGPTRSSHQERRLKEYLQSVKGLIKEQQKIDDLKVAGAGTPSSGTPGRPVKLPAPAILDPKPLAPGTVADGTQNSVVRGEVEKLHKLMMEVDRRLVSEVEEFKLTIGGRPDDAKRLKQALDGKKFDAVMDVIAVTVKGDKNSNGTLDVDGESVALAVRTITGKDAAPEVVEEIAGRIRDGHGAGPGQGGDRYQPIYENRFLTVGNNPLSTFSIDVDTASYSKVRRLIFQNHELPPPDAVRLEEFVNYHVYRYAGPKTATKTGVAAGTGADAAKNHPFAVHGDVAACPWRPGHKLLRVAIKGREIKNEDRPPSNLVFLVDVSGSMDEPDKLPLVKKGLKTLVQRLRAVDRVAIVVYAGQAGLVLPSTPGNEQAKILGVLDGLQPEGSTNGAQGIHLAYDIAAANFIKEGTNRVILATDGDFNVGTTSDAELVRLVEERAKSKVFLTTLGFGIGNHNDSMLEQIADKGNGQCAYIDTELEAYKVFVEQLSGTLVTIAKDVKIQVEFNPAKVAAYRLLGYENRMLNTEDFTDDTKDAGEIGAGHTVTALYEIVPVPGPKKPLEAPPVEDIEPTALKYQKPAELTEAARTAELLTVHLRYKQPDADKSVPLDVAVNDADVAVAKAPADFQFAAAVASFGMILRNSQYRGGSSYDNVLELAKAGLKDDEHGYRAEFVELVKRAKEIVAGRTGAAGATEKTPDDKK